MEITEVRVERVQEITEEDSRAEGILSHDGRGIGHSGYRYDIEHGYVYDTARAAFAALWKSINGPKFWNANPFVWVIKFKRLDGR